MFLPVHFVGIFLAIAGFVIGLGAVTVIDLHGFLGRTSAYWTEATTRTHKITKPLIWIGIALAIAGHMILYWHIGFARLSLAQLLIAIVLVVNGMFLSFSVSPYLLKREQEGKADVVLPKRWQVKITMSFVVSFLGWWSEVGLFVYLLLTRVL